MTYVDYDRTWGGLDKNLGRALARPLIWTKSKRTAVFSQDVVPYVPNEDEDKDKDSSTIFFSGVDGGGAVLKIFRSEEGRGSHFSGGQGGRASLACVNTA